MESRNESMLRRPNVYATIVGIYLLIALVPVFYTGVLLIQQQYETVKHSDPGGHGGGMEVILYGGVIAALMIVSPPSIAGAIQLFRRKKSGMYISFVALAILAVLLIYSVAEILGNINSGFSDTTLRMLNFTLGPVSTLIMYSLLIFTRKKVQWKSKSNLSQNNS